MFNNVESGFNHEGINNLDVVFQNVRNVLFTALSNGFLPTLAPVFGINADSSQFRSLVEDWAQGDFSQLPSIKILPSSSMNGANGGFSDKNRTIYLSSDYVSHASADRDPLTGLTGTLLEEIGHFVDSLVNPVSDTLGDEGELFAANLMGLSLSSQEQERIAQENDHSFFSVNGQIIPIEQSLPDLAGNTLATARVVTVGATATTFTDFVGNLDTDDYYKFTLASNSLLDLKLTGLTANAYIEILDGTGAWITGSYNDGIVDETIQRALTAGTYYIQVQPEVLADFSGWENTNYSLILVATASQTLATITVAATDTSAGETLTGQTANPGAFTLTRIGNLTQALTVNYTLSGTATKGTDYNNLTGTVSFAAGAATALVNINTIDDTLAEGSETVILTLGTGTGYTVGATNTATVTIADNEVLPVITIAATDGSAGETLTGQTANPGAFTLTRTGNLTQALTVNYTLSGTATKGTDYNNLTGTVSFAAGAATALVNINTIDDTLAEGSETVILTLGTGTGYTVGATNTATVTIADNEVLPVITIAATDGSAGETLTGQTANPGAFTLTRTGNLTQALTVNYTVAGTGTKGTDYNNLTGTVSFAAGAATALVNINTIDDTLAEGSETVILTLGTGTGYTVGATNTATVTIADNEVLPDLAGNTLATARVVTVGATATTFTDFVGNLDTDDYYKFTLASNSLLDLKLTGLTANAYIEILDGTGAWITGSYNDGIVDETIQRALTAGTYYIQVQPEVLADFSGWENTNYSLILVATALPADNAGNTLATARNITVGSTATTFSDFVGGNNVDPDDYYKFTLANASTVNLTLNGLNGNAGIKIVQDLNNNGAIDFGETLAYSYNSGTTAESISQPLASGSYFILVNSGFDNTNYNLSVSATGIPDNAGNTLATARNITVGSTATTFSDFVGGSVDPDDYYKFTLGCASTVNLTLNGLNGNAGIKIVQDLNNNGAIDFGETLAYSYNSGTTAQSISEALNVGTYFIHVRYGNTNYNLTVSATPLDNAGNTLTAARNINLNSPQTIFEFVGSIDVDDYYRFSLNTTNNFKLSLDDLSANADVQLIRDANNNNVVDSGELLVTIANTGTTAESITRSLSAGTYFIRVYPAATGVNTNYILGVSATPANTAPTNLDFNTTKVVYNENETVSLTGEVFDADGITTLSKIDFWLQQGNNGTWRDITDATTFTQSGGDNRWASFSYTLNAFDVLFTDVYQLKAIAYDKSGATSETVIKQFKVNRPPNTLYLSSLDSSYYAGKAVNLSGFVSDFDGFSDVVKIDLSLQKDGGDWNSVDSIISFDKDTNYSWSANFSYQLTGLSLGSYVLKARAYDQAGAYVDADVQSFKVVEIQKYTFTYNYGNGDYYDGYVYAENGKYNVGGDYDFTSTLNEAGFNGKYVIKSAETVGTPSDLGKVYVTKYYDADSSQQSYVPDCISNGFVSGYSYLGSEDDTIADPYRIGNISFGKDYDEADIVLPKQYSFKYEYGNGDYYEGYVYAYPGTYTVGQYYDPAPTVNGQYYISSAADVGSNFKSGDLKEVYLTNYYDGDTSQRSFTPKAPKNGYPSGYNLLGSEDDYIYDAAADINFHKFSPSLEADVPEAIPVFKYSFRYNYGNGDYYDGFVYARENTYTMGQIIDPKTTNTEAGTNGNYTITAIADSTNKYGTGSVYVTTYYDGDNSKVSFTLNQTYSSGYKYLGSEKRTIFLDSSSNGNIVSINGDGTLFDSFGEDNYEADFAVVKKFTFRYDYGNGDYYDGYVYADQNKYKVGQYYDFKLTNNEAGFNGKYYISAVANEGKWTDFGKVYVTNYYDGDNSKVSFTLNQTYPYPSSYNYLGTEKDAVSLDSSDNGNIVSIKGNSQLFGSFGEDNYEADFAVVKKFTFRYDYGNGDYYDGYVYADQNKYTVGQYYDFKLTNNEAGFNGKYYISAVTTEGNWKKLKGVYVTNYYDGDRSKQNYIPYYTSQGVTTGYNDLGSEEDYISEWGFGNKFGNDYEEADVVIVAKYSFRYNYGNGDYYDGFVYAEKYTYQVGTTFDPNPNNNEAGFNGKYSINAVEITGKNYDLGKVYVTNYYDGDRSKQNYIPLSYRDGLVTSYDGLGTEYDYISGFNSINKFGNDYDEADVSVTTKYSFTYNYNDGDSYSGYIYAEDGTYAINQSIGGAAGTYKITGAVVSGSKYDINKVYVTSYYDGNFSKQTYIPYSYTKGYASSYSGFGGEWDDFYINNILISFTYIQSGGNSSNFYRINVGDSVYEALSRTAAYQRKAPSDNNGSAKMTVGLVLSGFAGVPDNEYKVDQVFEDTSKGFFAVGLVANNPSSGRPPVLVIRGTANLYGAFDDTHPNGVGWEQFYSRRDQIVTWLNAVTTNAQKNPSFAAPDITGHSLGGAIAQRFGAYYSSTGGKIGEIITVNSPGIDSATINTANLSNIGNITYYIATGDPVSLAGKFLPGNWSRLAWNSPDSYLIGDYLLAKHTNPNRLTSNHVNEYWYSSTNNLNSPSFSYWQYNQPDWLTFNLSIAAVAPVVSLLTGGTLGTVISSLPVILSSRQTTEASRTLVGQALRAVIDYNRDPLGSLRNSILNYAKNYAQEAWDTFKNLDANEWAAIAKANPAMWAAMSKWTPDAWKSANSWTSDRWNVVKSWTSEAWNKTTSWTGDQWNKTKNWTTDQFKQGAQIGKEIIKSVDPRTWW